MTLDELARCDVIRGEHEGDCPMSLQQRISLWWFWLAAGERIRSGMHRSYHAALHPR